MTVTTHTLSVESEAIPLFLGRPALEPVRLSGTEGVNGLFEYELLLKTPDGLNIGASQAADFDLDAFIGREISCCIQLDGAGSFLSGTLGSASDHTGTGERQINAVIFDASLWGEEGRAVQYKLTLRPWLHLATLNTDCRIFQNMTVVDILDDLLADYPFSVEKRLIETYAPRDYQCQFNESDYAFFLRLTQEHGISFFQAHADGKHRLVLIDNMGAYRRNPSEAYHEVDYHPPGWKADAEYVHSFVPHNHLTSGKYSARDYDYTRPRADLSASRKEPRPTGLSDGEVYQWHEGRGGAHYAQPRAGTLAPNDPLDEGRNFALIRMQALRTHGSRAKSSGNLRGMVPGCSFELKRHPREKANTEYLILDTYFVIEDVGQASQIKDGASHRKQQWRVSVDFTAHPMNEPLRPAFTEAKPYSRGPQSAIVVGPAGENIWTDSLGRIKVQFPWDRIGQKNQHSSCWVRVASQWAGNQLGAVHIPRIGEEVIVEFFGGDPDLPICSAMVHNQSNLPPWDLPGQAALSGFRSRELTNVGGNSAAGRSNHWLQDDTAGQIQTQLKSDHESSSLSLGYITRIDSNAGRQDARGEGFELRSDAHGVLRAGQGLLLSTERRVNARAHVKDMGETLDRLTQARDQHETLASLARHHKAQDDDSATDQAAVSEQLRGQNDGLKGAGSVDAASGHFPEMSAPHLVLASASGLAASAATTLHVAAGNHIAMTSGGHTSLSSAKSFLASALDSVRLFAQKAGIRIFAGQGPVQLQAQDDRIELIAHKVLEIISTTDWVTVKGKEGISFEVGRSSFKITSDGFRFYTPGVHHAWAGSHQTFGPKTLTRALPEMPTSVCIPCLLKAAKAGSAITRF